MLPYLTVLSTNLLSGPEHADSDRRDLVVGDVAVPGVGAACRLVVVDRFERANHLVCACRNSHSLVFQVEARNRGRRRDGDYDCTGPGVHDMDELFARVAEPVAVGEGRRGVGRDDACFGDVLNREVDVCDGELRSVNGRSVNVGEGWGEPLRVDVVAPGEGVEPSLRGSKPRGLPLADPG